MKSSIFSFVLLLIVKMNQLKFIYILIFFHQKLILQLNLSTMFIVNYIFRNKRINFQPCIDYNTKKTFIIHLTET